jgi:hypothetical protein
MIMPPEVEDDLRGRSFAVIQAYLVGVPRLRAASALWPCQTLFACHCAPVGTDRNGSRCASQRWCRAPPSSLE